MLNNNRLGGGGGLTPTTQTILKYIPALIIEHILQLENPADRQFPEVQPLQTVVIFADISGFTSISEKSAELGARGSEELAFVINRYMEDLVKIIAKYGGDIIKFIGDAMIVLWPPKVSNRKSVHHTAKDQDKAETILTNCRKAVQCAIEIQQQLNNKQIRKGFKPLSVKIGVGVGSCALMHVGGVFERAEFFAVGDGLKQALDSEHHIVRGGQIVVSPQVWQQVAPHFKAKALEGGFQQILQIQGVGVRSRADALILRAQLDADDIHRVQKYLRFYVPAAIIPYIEQDREPYGHETRLLTIMFVSLGVDLSQVESKEGLRRIQNIVTTVQKCVYRFEGSVNKLVMDDKGSTLICIWGMPPYAHHDDPTLAVLTALMMRKELARGCDCWCNIGIATGVVFSGVVGTSGGRKEYSVLGDTANLAARIMYWNKFKKVDENGFIHVDEATKKAAEGDISFQYRQSFRFKGKSVKLPVFYPIDPEQDIKSYLSSSHEGVRVFGKLKREREVLKLRTNPFLADNTGQIQKKIVQYVKKSDEQIKEFIDELNDFCSNPEFSKVISIEGPPGAGKTLFVRAALERFNQQYFEKEEYEDGEGIVLLIGTLTRAKDKLFLNIWRPILRKLLALQGKRKRIKQAVLLSSILAKRSAQATQMLEEIFSEPEQIQDRISFNRFDISFLKEQECERQREVLKTLVIFFKKLLGEDEERSLLPPPMIIVLDSTWLMDQASWELLGMLKSECKRIAFVLVLRTDPDNSYKILQSAQPYFDEQSVDEDIDFNIEIERATTQDLEVLTASLLEGYRRTYSQKIIAMTEPITLPKKQEQEEEDRQSSQQRAKLLQSHCLMNPEIARFSREVLDMVRLKCEGNALLCLEFIFNLMTTPGYLELDLAGVASLTDEAKESSQLDDWRRIPAPFSATQWLGQMVDSIQRPKKGGVKLVLLLKAAAVLGQLFTQSQLNEAYPGRKESADLIPSLLSKLQDPVEMQQRLAIQIIDEIPEHGLLIRFLRPFLKEVIYQRMLFAEQRKPLHETASNYLQVKTSFEEDSELECKRMVRHILAFEDIAREKDLSTRAKKKVNIKRVQTLIRSGAKVIKRGELTKEGDKASKNIEKRYVILTQSEFQYFHSEEESKRIRYPLGTIILEHIYNVIPAKRSLHTSDFFIGAGVWKKKNIERELREFVFGAEDDDERDQWITAINLLRARAVHRGFENKFGKINIQELSPSKRADLKPKYAESSQVLSFTKKRRESDASLDRLRKSTSFRGKLLRSITGVIKNQGDEEHNKLKSTFTSMLGFFLADAFACIGHNSVNTDRTRLGKLKPLLSDIEQHSRDSFFDSEYSLSSSKGGEDSTPSRVSKVTFQTKTQKSSPSRRELFTIQEQRAGSVINPSTIPKEGPNLEEDSKEGGLRRSVSSIVPMNFSSGNSSKRKGFSEKITEIDRSLSPLPTDQDSFAKTEEQDASASPTVKLDKELEAKKQNEEEERALIHSLPYPIFSNGSRRLSRGFSQYSAGNGSLTLTEKKWDEGKEGTADMFEQEEAIVIGSVNNGIKTPPRIRSELLVEEEVVKKRLGPRRPNSSMQHFQVFQQKQLFSSPVLTRPISSLSAPYLRTQSPYSAPIFGHSYSQAQHIISPELANNYLERGESPNELTFKYERREEVGIQTKRREETETERHQEEKIQTTERVIRHQKRPSERYSRSQFSMEEEEEFYSGKDGISSQLSSPEKLMKLEQQLRAHADQDLRINQKRHYETPGFNSGTIESGGRPKFKPSHPGDTQDNSLLSDQVDPYTSQPFETEPQQNQVKAIQDGQLAVAMQNARALNNKRLMVKESELIRFRNEIKEHNLLQIEMDGKVGLFPSKKFKKVSARYSPKPILVDLGPAEVKLNEGELSSIEEQKERSEERSVQDILSRLDVTQSQWELLDQTIRTSLRNILTMSPSPDKRRGVSQNVSTDTLDRPHSSALLREVESMRDIKSKEGAYSERREISPHSQKQYMEEQSEMQKPKIYDIKVSPSERREGRELDTSAQHSFHPTLYKNQTGEGVQVTESLGSFGVSKNPHQREAQHNSYKKILADMKRKKGQESVKKGVKKAESSMKKPGMRAVERKKAKEKAPY